MNDPLRTDQQNTPCAGCGMQTNTPREYHPHAACLMFRACHNADEVRANLDAVIEYGRVKERKSRLTAKKARSAT